MEEKKEKVYMNYKIRKAEKADFEVIRQIYNDVQNLHVEMRPEIYKSDGDILPLEDFITGLENESFYVADINGSVVGVMQLYIRHIESPYHVTRNILFIDSMAVVGEHRGKGIGHSFF